MDTLLTTGEVAKSLGTTRSRIHRAVTAEVVHPASTPGGHLRFTSRDVAALERHLGRTPPLVGLSREAVRALAALARRPLGLRSARAVARATGMSPTAASQTLKRLQHQGLVKRQNRRVVLGRVVDVEVWQVNAAHPRWQQLSPVLDRAVVSNRWVDKTNDRKVPGWLRHLFWNVDVDRLDVRRDGPFIAGRVLGSDDAQAHAWAATTLTSDAFLAAASQRGLDPRRVALARNLAARRGS